MGSRIKIRGFLQWIGVVVIGGVALCPLSWSMENTYSVGALFGVGAYNNNGGTNITFGANANALIVSNVTFGINLTYTPLSNFFYDNTITVMDSSILHLDADLVYRFSESRDGLWGGARLGLASYNANSNSGSLTVDYSSLGFEWGPVIGYDYVIAGNYSIGVDVSYLSSMIKTLNDKDMRGLQLLGAFRYNF